MSTRTPTATDADGAPVARRDGMPDDRNPALVYLGSLADSSRRVMRSSLAKIAELVVGGSVPVESFPWERIRFQHAAKIRRELEHGYAPSTVNRDLSALRGVLKSAWKLGLMDGESYRRAADVKNITAEKLPSGRMVSGTEILSLMLACRRDDGPAGARDAALFSLLYGLGLRRSETVGLDLSDYDPDTGELRVTGKGRKDRRAWVTNGARDHLHAWLEIRGDEPGPLLLPVTNGGDIEHRRLSDQAVYNRVKRRARQAELEDLTPHDLRRSFLTSYLDGGGDLSMAASLAGHASPETTGRYDMRGEDERRDAFASITVPTPEAT